MANVEVFAALNMAAVNEVALATHVVHSSASYTWGTAGNTQVTLLSGPENITVDAANFPSTGTVNAVSVFSTLSSTVLYGITGLSAPVTGFFDNALQVAAVAHRKFWQTALAGTTTISGDVEVPVTAMGDHFTVLPGQSLTGAGDTFTFTRGGFPLVLTLAGDALSVDVTGQLTGGLDRFTLNSVAADADYEVSGDAQVNNGTLIGGADVLTVTGLMTGSELIGDVRANNATLTGAADIIAVTAASTDPMQGARIVGDARTNIGTVTAGSDTLSLTGTNSNFDRAGWKMTGDVEASSAGVVTGGADRITVTNALASIAGDVSAQSGGLVTGGNDVITAVNVTMGLFISGDVGIFTGGVLTPGADIITGGSGNDTIAGESDTQNFPGIGGTTVNAGGNDVINGAAGNDTLLGQVGNDALIGGTGNDIINGGSGGDLARFDTSATLVFVDLEGIDGTGADELEALGQGADQLIAIEGVLGSNFGDTLKGDSQNNTLNGIGGDDILNGRAGGDVLTGGLGRDTLTGAAGNDVFDFNLVTETAVAVASADVITDFTAGDRIDLAGIDANVAVANDQPFAFITTPLTGVAQVRVFQSGGNTIVEGSTDADAAAEFSIVLTGLKTLTGTDFVL